MAGRILFSAESGLGALPLVLLHPVGLDHTFWGALPEKCAKTHRVIAIDLPGHGKSDSVDGVPGVAEYADAVLRTLDALDVSKADILGLSFGGMIAQELAIRRPQIVRRLVVGACGGSIPSEARTAVKARGQLALEHGMEGVLETTLQRWFTDAFRSHSEVARVAKRLLDDSPSAWNAAWNAIAGHDALGRLNGLDMPALVVVGDKDLGTSVKVAQTLAEAIPASRFVVVPDAPHMLQIECPDVFSSLVADFLSG